MSSTFTPNKLYELMGTGDHPGTWGTEVNTSVFTIMDLNLGGRLSISVAGNSNVTISNAQAQNVYHTLTGALTGNIQYILPTLGGFYFINNATSGAFTITVIMASGTGVVVPQGSSAIVFANPDTPAVIFPQNYLSALTLGTALAVAQGGTGATTASGAMLNLGTAVTLTAGTGLTGGGDISVGRTFSFATIASNNLLANITGGVAVPIANTLTALIDSAIGGVQGNLLYRDTSTWKTLTPGTNGFFLQAQGAGANPVWAAFSPLTLTLTAGSAPSTPAAGTGVLYEKSSDKNLYFKNDAGLESELLSSTNTTNLGITAQNTAKAFATFTQSGTTVTFTAGNWFNVTSIVRTAPGVYTVTFTNALPTTNYLVVGIGYAGGSGAPVWPQISSALVGSFTLTMMNTVPTASDISSYCSFTVFGF